MIMIVLIDNHLEAPWGESPRLTNFDTKLTAKPPDASVLRCVPTNGDPYRAAREVLWRIAANKGGEAPANLSIDTYFEKLIEIHHLFERDGMLDIPFHTFFIVARKP